MVAREVEAEAKEVVAVTKEMEVAAKGMAEE